MGNYTSVPVSSYNDSPPTDDGATTEANRGKWATVLGKLTNPLKTAVEGINTSLLTLLNNNTMGYADDTGAADAYVISVAADVIAYADGQTFKVVISATNTGASTLNVNSLGAKAIQTISSGALAALAGGELPVGHIALVVYDSSLGLFVLTNPIPLPAAATGLLQRVASTTVSMTTHTTVLPVDDTIPQQSTDGSSVLTASITPSSATNRLLITFSCPIYGSSAANAIGFALYQDSTEAALAATASSESQVNEQRRTTFVHEMAAGTTIATTFKVFVGPGTAATVTINGVNAGRLFGGVATTTLTILEMTA